MKNRRGLRIDPWGTPWLTGAVLKFVSLIMCPSICVCVPCVSIQVLLHPNPSPIQAFHYPGHSLSRLFTIQSLPSGCASLLSLTCCSDQSLQQSSIRMVTDGMKGAYGEKGVMESVGVVAGRTGDQGQRGQ